jgi:thymidine phosphorylase
MIWLAGKAASANAGYEQALALLENGAALAAFEKFLNYQGPADISGLPVAACRADVTSAKSGYIQNMNCEQIGLAGIELGAGRLRTSDKIDYTAGIEVLVRIGDKITQGQTLFRIFANKDEPFSNAKKMLTDALSVSEAPPTERLPLIAQVLT